jgi:hypothetical protein
MNPNYLMNKTVVLSMMSHRIKLLFSEVRYG